MYKENRLIGLANLSTYAKVLGHPVATPVVAPVMSNYTGPAVGSGVVNGQYIGNNVMPSGGSQSDLIPGNLPAGYNPVTQAAQSQQDINNYNAGIDSSGNRTGSQQTIEQILAGIDGNARAANAAGNSVSVEDIAAQKQTAIAQYNATQQMAAQQQQTFSNQAKTAATNGVAPTTPVAPPTPIVHTGGTTLAHPFAGGAVGNNGIDRSTFIQQQRDLGKSDAEIRGMIRSLPPEQTGGAKPVTPTTPAPTTPSGTSPASTTAPSTPSTTTTPLAGTKAGAPVLPPINPQANVLRQLSATEADPIMKIALQAAADQLDAIGVQGNPMGQADFNAGANGTAISTPYDAIQKILDNATATAKNSETSTQTFLDNQLARNDTFNAKQQASQQQQLQWQNDKAVRDQTDANRDNLNRMTIQLALEGGFGSADGNNDILTARLKGEQAIQDLNKEYGFKMTDVSLAFTQAHNQAHDTYQQNWLKAADDFETKVNNLDLQGISNQGAKASALSSAYKNYVGDIKQARLDYAKTITDATQTVQAAHQKAQEFDFNQKKAAQEFAWQQIVHQDAQDNASASREVAAMNHTDALSQQSATGISSQLQSIRQKLQTASQPYDVYVNAQQFKSSFDDAYKIFTDPNATQGDRATADAQMAFQFSHFQNIGSLRIQEVAGDAAKGNQSAATKISANISSWLNGGSALDQTTRDAMKGLIEAHTQDLQKAAATSLSTAWSDAQAANRNFPNAPAPITPDQLTSDPALLNSIYQNQDKAASDWWDTGSQGSFSPSAMRTDRNNNPTAMTTDVARTAGLVAGIDYVQGDPFPNNPKLHTAKLLGDPIATTIKAIDNAGFTTASGQPRWTYTNKLGLNNAIWATMTPQQKALAVQKMYKQEGGNGSLFSTMS